MSITLNDLSEAVSALKEAAQAVEDANNELKEAKKKELTIREETIPGMMQELGFEKIKLESGEEVSCKQEVYCSIPKDCKYQAFEWLEENGHGGLIKTEIKVSYGKGELEEAIELESRLATEGLRPSLAQNVHAQTLKAFVKEQLAAGNDLPLELFGARPVMTAKVK